MLIDVNKITEKGISFNDHLEVDDKFLIDGGGYFIGNLHYSISLIQKDDQIKVKGKIKTTVSLKCVRCLENFEMKVNSIFDIVLFPANLIHISNHHLNDGEMEYIFYEDDKIDLDKMLIEQTNFLIPLNAVCDSECKGLCPVCGVDLNQDKCKCENSLNEISLVFDKIKR